MGARYLATVAVVLALSAINVLAANSAGCSRTATLKSGTQTMQVNGKSRQYILRIPDGYSNSKPYKLIFGFHCKLVSQSN